MSLLTRHVTIAWIDRFLKFNKRAKIQVEQVSGAPIVFDAVAMARVSDPATRNVSLAVSTTIDPAVHESRSLILGGAGTLRTETLPFATGSGAVYRFIVGAVNTSSYVIKTSRGADTFDGGILQGNSASSGACRLWNPAATDDTITLNGTTTGGASIGDWVEVQDIAVNQWSVTGIVTSAGAATPFSDTVA